MTENITTPEENNQQKKRGRKPKTLPISIESSKQTLSQKAERLIPIFEVLEKFLVSISILIPFIFLSIGGISQVLALKEIGLEYVRFFSVSQLLSDSLVIFSTVLFKGLFPLILGILLGLILTNLTKKEGSLATILIITGFTIAFIDSGKTYFIFVMFGLSIPAFYCLFFFYLIPNIKRHFKEKAYLLFILAIALVILYFCQLIYIAKITTFDNLISAHRSLTFLKELVNYKKIHNTYASKNIKDSIIYFNDQYIFIQLRKDSITNKQVKMTMVSDTITAKEIEILRFSELFKP